jgi:hypothetical protein
MVEVREAFHPPGRRGETWTRAADMSQDPTNNSYGPPNGGPSFAMPDLWGTSGRSGGNRLNAEERSEVAWGIWTVG